MTVAAQETVFIHTGNGVTTTFAYGCLVLLESDLEVSLDGVVQTSGYTVSGVGNDSGGSVVFSSTPADGTAVVVRRLLPLTRDTDFQQRGDWKAAEINPDFDRAWMALQQQQEQIGRSLRFPLADTATSAELPSVADRAGKVMSFDENGNPAVSTTDADNVVAAQAAADAAAASAASINLPSVTGKAANLLRVKADESGYELRTQAETLADIGAEPADATILKDADIGVTVQGYDSTILNDADIGVSVQAYDANLRPLTLGTPVTTSGSLFYDITSIPSWVKRITLMLNGVSGNGTSPFLIQLGDAGGIEPSGYTGGYAWSINSASGSALNSSAGFPIFNGGADYNLWGAVTLTRFDGSNTWVCSGSVMNGNSASGGVVAGVKQLSATLDRIRITHTNGSDTFDGGSINILYE